MNVCFAFALKHPTLLEQCRLQVGRYSGGVSTSTDHSSFAQNDEKVPLSKILLLKYVGYCVFIFYYNKSAELKGSTVHPPKVKRYPKQHCRCPFLAHTELLF